MTTLLCRVLLSVLVGGAVPVFADLAGNGDPFDLYFDESGNAFYALNGGPLTALRGVSKADPTGGVTGNVMVYQLPELVITGDVRVFEQATAAGTLSDMMRFADASGHFGLTGGFTLTGTQMIFYSDVEAGPPDTGVDSGFPTITAFNDSGGCCTEDASGNFVWLPGGNRYFGFSDGTIPEPASLILLGTATILVGYIARRRRLAAN